MDQYRCHTSGIQRNYRCTFNMNLRRGSRCDTSTLCFAFGYILHIEPFLLENSLQNTVFLEESRHVTGLDVRRNNQDSNMYHWPVCSCTADSNRPAMDRDLLLFGPFRKIQNHSEFSFKTVQFLLDTRNCLMNIFNMPSRIARSG